MRSPFTKGGVALISFLCACAPHTVGCGSGNVS